MLDISLLHMHAWFLHSYHMDPCTYCMYDYSRLSPFILHVLLCRYHIHVIWLFPVTDMDIAVTGHESCWYAICGNPTSIVPVSRYIVLCYQQSSGPVIMLPVSCTVFVPVTLYTCNKDNLGMGETWRLIRSYRVDVWIHCLSHCRGRGSAGYRLLLMSIPLLF